MPTIFPTTLLGDKYCQHLCLSPNRVVGSDELATPRCSLFFAQVTEVFSVGFPSGFLRSYKTNIYGRRGLYTSFYVYIFEYFNYSTCIIFLQELISDFSSANITSCRDRPLFSLPNSAAKQPQNAECRVYHHLPWQRPTFGPIPLLFVV